MCCLGVKVLHFIVSDGLIAKIPYKMLQVIAKAIRKARKVKKLLQ